MEENENVIDKNIGATPEKNNEEKNIEEKNNVEKELDSVADVFENIKNQYECKIKSLEDTKNREIEKRDKIIAELINGSKSEEPVVAGIDTLIKEIFERRQKQNKY